MIDFEKVQQNFAKDLSDSYALVAYGQKIIKYGTFSERRPDLGRMVRCPFCRRRRRAFSPEVCCNSAYTTTQRAWDQERGFYQEEVFERKQSDEQFQAGITKQLVKKLVKHKKHGQNKMFKIRQLMARFSDPFEIGPGGCICHPTQQPPNRVLLAACAEMQVPVPKTHQETLTFAQKYTEWKQDRRDRYHRRQAAISRRVNRGLAKNGSRDTRRGLVLIGGEASLCPL